MKIKKSGFSLIELLVVIVIMGILATISIGTFSQFFKNARDAKRKAFVETVSNIIKSDQATVWKDDTASGGIQKYKYGDKDVIAAILAKNDVLVPAEEDFCYFYGFSTGASGNDASDNEFYVATWGENENSGAGAPIINGTIGATNLVKATTAKAKYGCSGTVGSSTADSSKSLTGSTTIYSPAFQIN